MLQKIKDLKAQVAAKFAEANTALEAGEVEKTLALAEEAKQLNDEAAQLEAAVSKIEILKGDFNRPTNDIPLAAAERAVYDPNDTGAKTLADYRPATYVKGLHPAIQPLWVQKQMGDNLKAEAKFYTDTWLQWLRCKNQQQVAHFFASLTPQQLKAMQENTDNEGGYMVPEEYRTQVIHDPGVPSGVFRPLCTVGTTSLKDGYWPTIGSVTWAAIAEEAAYGDNTPTIGQVSFSVRKAGGTVKVSMELLEDAAANLPALLAMIFQEARGRWEDEQVIAGDGTTEPEGLRTASITDVVMANATSIVALDLIELYTELPAQFRANATFATTSSLLGQMLGIQSTGAGLHFNGDINGGDMTRTPNFALYGRPMVFFDGTGWDSAAAIASGEELGAFGDFRHYYMIDRIGMSLRRDDSIYVANDQVGFFARARQDGRVGLTNAFRILKAA